MSKYKWHKVNFYEYVPLPIYSMSFSKQCNKIAVSRCEKESAFIEIWNITGNWYLEQTLLAVKSVEALVWFNDRLFSVGLDEQVLEYNLRNGLVKKKLNSFNGPIWCACLNNTLKMLAVGTDSGTIVLFDVCEEPSFKHSLMKQKDPILSICWHEESNTIVVGGTDIRVWNVETLQMIQKISVAKDALIWALALSSDFTIVSGDSTGHTCFWVGKPGSLQYSKRFRSHEADIHSVNFSSDESLIHVGGVDCLMCFQLTTPNDDSQGAWVMAGKLNYHSNDIRSVIYAGNLVVSAGLDCNIFVNNLLNNNIFKILPFPQLPIAHSISQKSSILLQYHHHLEVWKLGKSSQDFDTSGIELSLEKEECNLLKLNVGASYISCSAASSCGSFIAYSNHRSTFLYHLNLTNDIESQKNCLKEIKHKFLNKFASTCLLFSSDSCYFFCATRSSEIKIFTIDEKSINLKYTIPSSVVMTSSPPTIMALNTSSKYLAIADCQHGVHIYNIKKQKLIWSLPSRNSSPVCLSFNTTKQTLLVVAYSDRMIIEADINEKAFTPWCRKFLNFPSNKWMQAKSCIKRIFYNLNDNNEILVQDEKGFYIMQKQKFLDEKLKKDVTDVNTSGILYNDVKYLLYMDVLDENNMLTIERSSRDIIECLPPPIKKHKFGI